MIAPWRVSMSHWSQDVEDAVNRYCGGDDQPVLLSNPNSYKGYALQQFATLELELEDATAKRLPIKMSESGVLISRGSSKPFARSTMSDTVAAQAHRSACEMGRRASQPLSRQPRQRAR